MKPTVVGFIGFKESGKSTAAAHLVSKYGFVEESFAKTLKDSILTLDPIVDYEVFGRASEVVDTYGWDKAKKSFPELRRLLEVYGTDVAREQYGEDFWVDMWRKRAVWHLLEGVPVTSADVRFHNEVETIRSAGDYALIIRVQDDTVPDSKMHISNTQHLEINEDYTIPGRNVASIPDMLHVLDGIMELEL